MRVLSNKHGGKRVVFAEIGYARSLTAASKPWEPAEDEREEVTRLRRLLLDVSLAELKKHEPLVAGAFWWKWMPGWQPWDADFSMKDPEARAALPSSRRSCRRTALGSDRHASRSTSSCPHRWSSRGRRRAPGCPDRRG